MLKRRLIPKLLLKTIGDATAERLALVTTRRFEVSKLIGNPVSQAKIYEAQLADELIVLSIDRGKKAIDALMLRVIERLATETFMPLTIGGGVTRIEDFHTLLTLGADKVSVNSAAFRDPALLGSAAATFGSQCVVVSIDFKVSARGPEVWIDGGQQPTGVHPAAWACRAVAVGAGEVLLCDIDRDGGCQGMNVTIAREIASSVTVPVLLSGGCGQSAHLVAGFLEGMADGIAAGTFFSLRDQNPMQARAHVANAGIPIRTQF